VRSRRRGGRARGPCPPAPCGPGRLGPDGSTGPPIQPIEEVAVLAAHEAARLAGVSTPAGGRTSGLRSAWRRGSTDQGGVLSGDPQGWGCWCEPHHVSPLRRPKQPSPPDLYPARPARRELHPLRRDACPAPGDRAGHERRGARRGPPLCSRVGDLRGRESSTPWPHGRPDDGQAGSGACLFPSWSRRPSSGAVGGPGNCLGYAEALAGRTSGMRLQACLEDAGVRVEQVKGGVGDSGG